jgi:hypothetical protein
MAAKLSVLAVNQVLLWLISSLDLLTLHIRLVGRHWFSEPWKIQHDY